MGFYDKLLELSYQQNHADGRAYTGDDDNPSIEQNVNYKSVILSWFTKITMG